VLAVDTIAISFILSTKKISKSANNKTQTTKMLQQRRLAQQVLSKHIIASSVGNGNAQAATKRQFNSYEGYKRVTLMYV